MISTPTKQKQESLILSGTTNHWNPNFVPERNPALFEGVKPYREMAAGSRAEQISVMRKASEGLARGVGAINGSNYVINFTCFQFKEGKYKTLHIPKKVLLY